MSIRYLPFGEFIAKFLHLEDTPDSYGGQAGKLPYIKTTEDGLEFLTQKAVGFTSRVRAYLATAVQTITSGVITKVQLNAEDYDSQGEFDPTTDYRFTAKKTGYYQVNAVVRWTGGVDQDYTILYIYKNGAAVAANVARASGTGYFSQSISDIIYLAANDYLELDVYQGTGTDKSLEHDSIWTFMAIHKLSE